MIQILVCDKVYVTPEMKRKKLLYKIYFILSVFLVISLCTYYIYAEYDRNKSEQVSQEILEGIDIPIDIGENNTEPTEERVTLEDDVIVVILNDESEEEINIDELVATAQEEIAENEANESVAVPTLYTAKDGTEYYVIAVITIPKLGITYPVLSTWSNELLKNATCKYKGPDPNEVGNFVIIGHNYRDESKNAFFTNIHKLNTLDIIQLTDMSGRTVEYSVYSKDVISDNDFSCTNQITDGKKVITLLTCYNYGKQRTVIKAVENK